MNNLLENFTDNELVNELERRQFEVVCKDVDDIDLDLLDDDDLTSHLEDNGFIIYDDTSSLIQKIVDDYEYELLEEISKRKNGGIYVSSYPNTIDFRKTDCSKLLEDIVRTKGWNYLYEVLERYR